MRQAILCHENLHVERRDWLFTVAEELVRAALWFHPAIWWLLAEIQLAREQAVDARVVEITEARDPYVDALLEMAGARPELDLAPAPLFLRKRHLKQRVVEIVREATMSKTRWISAMAASVVFLAGACWLVTGAFPLQAEPQVVSDAPGVTVDTSGAQIVSRTGVRYPEAAIEKGVQGTIVVQVKVGTDGAVLGVTPVSGPQELREAVLQPVFDWRFAKDAAGGTRQIVVTFDLPKDAAAQLHEAQRARLKEMYTHASNRYWNRVIESVIVSGISEQAKADLLARLPVHAGDTLTEDLMIDVSMVVSEFDMRLGILTSPDKDAVIIRIGPQAQLGAEPDGDVARMLPTAPAAAETSASGGQRIRVGGDVQAAKLITKVQPVYPPLAKQANIQGTVVLTALIGKDGHMQDLKVVRGHPLLVQAALDAIRQWVYQPTMIDGEPVEVRTEISLNFLLPPSGNGEARVPPEGYPSVTIHNEPPSSQASINLHPPSGGETPQLEYRKEPEYPQAARQFGAHGTVVFDVVIGKDGAVEEAKVVSGHPLLVQAAKDAVMQWRYKPTFVNGEPVEVHTQVSLNFVASPSDGGEAPRQIRVGGNVQAANLITRIGPKYPAEAKKAGIQGTVKLYIIVNKDGTVQGTAVLSGDPELAKAAQEAVQQWVYRPTFLNGQPVEVQTTVDVTFTLQ
jgi:TonB family protein